MGKKSRKDAVKQEEAKTALATEKTAAAKAAKVAAKVAGKVAAVVAKTAEVVKERVIEPVVEVVAPPKKVKKARFLREKKEARPADTTPALPKPSTKSAAKLMTKGLVIPPKEDPRTSQKPKP